MNPIKIIDVVDSALVAKKPIVLTHCLQNSFANKDNIDQTSLSLYASKNIFQVPSNTTKVERLASVPMYNDIPPMDLIVVYRNDSNPVVYLGHWNDGVL